MPVICFEQDKASVSNTELKGNFKDLYSHMKLTPFSISSENFFFFYFSFMIFTYIEESHVSLRNLYHLQTILSYSC